MGRQLAEAVAQLPKLTKGEMQQLCADDAQNVLLTSYLANLLRTHITLADKLGTAQLPIM